MKNNRIKKSVLYLKLNKTTDMLSSHDYESNGKMNHALRKKRLGRYQGEKYGHNTSTTNLC